MNDLEKYFIGNTGRLIHKWNHYFEIYERHFSRFRGTDVHVVEFGISQGGSLKMWKDYFGPQAKIFGVDINPRCRKLQEEQIEIFIGSQEDRGFLKSLIGNIPRIDILIDDGGHTMEQQINTYEELFSHISENGVYFCEDLYTSYWPKWGGGYKKRGTFIEYSKNFIDYINAWHSLPQSGLRVTGFTTAVHSLHYYDSVLVIEKRSVKKPFHLKTGNLKILRFQDLKLNRTKVIQRIIELIQAKTYLEIGVEKGFNFLKIQAEKKIAVDPKFQFAHPLEGCEFYEMPSDQFFETQNDWLKKTGLDVVFIDGMHTYEQSLKDVLHSLEFLKPGGVIIMHDCFPISAATACPVPPKVRKPWVGEVWKTIVWLRSNRPDLRVCVLDCDWGLGVITKGFSGDLLGYSESEIQKMNWNDFQNDKERLLNMQQPEYLEKFLLSKV